MRNKSHNDNGQRFFVYNKKPKELVIKLLLAEWPMKTIKNYTGWSRDSIREIAKEINVKLHYGKETTEFHKINFTLR